MSRRRPIVPDEVHSGRKIAYTICALVALAVVCLVASAIHLGFRTTVADATTPQSATVGAAQLHGNVDQNGKEGLPGDGDLSTEPFQVLDGDAYFDDRTVTLYQTDDATVGKATEDLATFFDGLPVNVPKYLMVAPTRAAYEPSLADQTQDQERIILQIADAMPADVHDVNLFGMFKERSNEYLYFRTDSSWTNLAAYYAARELLMDMKYEVHDLGEYMVDSRTTLTGNQEGEDLPSDRVDVYTLPKQGNRTEYHRVPEGGVEEVYNAPTVGVSRGGLDVILGPSTGVGGRLSYAIAEGDGPEGTAFFVVGDSDAKQLVPFLVPYFGEVIYIQSVWTKLEPDTFQALFAGRDVQGVLAFLSLDDVEAGDEIFPFSELVVG